MKKQLTVLFLFLSSFSLFAQEKIETADTLRKDALRVYYSGASDYIKREITFINYVRDLKEAQLYIISTSESTGSGGRQYSYNLVGQHEFSGMCDTISVNSSPDETEDQVRQKQVSVLKMGLMRYIVKTPIAKHIDIRFTQPMKEEVTTDKWDNWVFRTQVSGYLNGQKSVSYSDIYGSFTASRITKDWKYIFNIYYDRGVDKYDLGLRTVTSENISKSVEGMIVKSINNHWSVGGSYDLGSSSYSNYKFMISATPGIEFNIFPYSESTRRQFSFLYSAGFRYNNYKDTTIYNKTKENLWMHSIRGTYSVIQKWGSVSVSTYYSNYFHDWSFNYLSFSGSLSLRIVKGLSLSISGSTSMIHNQLALVKGGATQEQILTRQKELETQYSYYTSVGLSYTFGSIFNNVVNPRFGN